MSTKHPVVEKAEQALSEIGSVISKALPSQLDKMVKEIEGAKRIMLYGVGREGLMLKSFAMRLYHLGLDVHVVGDMTTPPISSGDLLIVSAGPGSFSTVSALLQVAKTAGAVSLCVTAQPNAVDGEVDIVIHLDAQTMANDSGPAPSVLPMGSLFEGVQFMFFEILVLVLRDVLKVSSMAMRARHTNLE